MDTRSSFTDAAQHALLGEGQHLGRSRERNALGKSAADWLRVGLHNSTTADEATTSDIELDEVITKPDGRAVDLSRRSKTGGESNHTAGPPDDLSDIQVKQRRDQETTESGHADKAKVPSLWDRIRSLVGRRK